LLGFVTVGSGGQEQKAGGDVPGAGQFVQQALQHHRAHQLHQAGALYYRALSIDPNEATALQMLGLIAIERGNHFFAAGLITEAIAHRPDDAGAHYNLGLALQNLGRLEDAIASYGRAIALRHDLTGAHFNRGNALKELGRLTDAVTDYQRAISMQPRLVPAYANMAMCLTALGRADDALANYETALALTPNEPGLHNEIGAVLAELGRLDEAAAAYCRALALDPSLVATWFNLHGCLYDDEGERAAQCLEKALQISPDHQLSRFFLGVLRERQGCETAAKAHFATLPAECDLATFGRDSWEYVKAVIGLRVRLFGETAEGLAIGLGAASVPGLVLEFGVRHGTTIRQIAALAKQEVHGFDTFTGLPEAWDEHPAGTYSTAGKLPELSANVHLYAGLFAETLPQFLQTHHGAVRFVNVDCDLYSATQTVLALLASRIVPGTVIAFDEYLCTEHWRDGEFRAFQEAAAAYGWRYDYIAVSLLSKQAVVVIR
jgi:tetratricopeptide (TPR) repeat protein